MIGTQHLFRIGGHGVLVLEFVFGVFRLPWGLFNVFNGVLELACGHASATASCDLIVDRVLLRVCTRVRDLTDLGVRDPADESDGDLKDRNSV